MAAYIHVTYDANGGQGKVPEDINKYVPGGRFTVLSGEGLTSGNDDYTFFTWNTRADGTGTTYTPGEEYEITENLTLYAQWAHEHDGIVFQPWSSSTSLPDEAGSYFLMSDVNLGVLDNWVTTGTVNLCLNGHTITTVNEIIIYNGSTLNLYDCSGDQGKITGVEYGMTMYGAFNMHGGVITGFTGWAVYAKDTYSSFTMTGGKITGNAGVGVLVPPFSSFNVSDTPIIEGNTEANVRLEQGQDSGKKVYGIITVQGSLTENARIGVTGWNNSTNVITSGLSGKGTLDNFFSDVSTKIVWLTKKGEAQLTPFWTVTFDSDGGTEIEPQKVAKSAKATEPETPTKEGYTFKGWYKVTRTNPETLEETAFDFDTAVKGNITLKAVWEETQQVTINGVSGSFNDRIKLNFYFGIPDAVHSDEKAYVTLTNERTGETTTLLIKNAALDAEKGYKFSICLAAKEASDTISAKVFDGRGNPLVIIGNTSGNDYSETGIQYSLMQYFAWLEEEGTDAEEKAVGAAAKDYCSAAQIYFKYNADNVSVSSAVSAVTADTLSGYIAGREGTLPDGVSIHGITAMLESDNTLRLYLGFKNVEPGSFTYAIDGKAVELKQRPDGLYYLAMDVGVLSNRLQDAHTYSVSDGTNTYTITASVLTFARAIANKSNIAYSNLGKALYLYNKAAVAAFGE